jgi:small subunit ribosomal protein S35
MAEGFKPPTEKQVLRFRYTTYLGEMHPAAKKVVVEFCPADMPDLTPIQVEKLKKLAGTRYNAVSGIIKMSSERFEGQMQNKRYLGDLVNRLLDAAKVSFKLYMFNTSNEHIRMQRMTSPTFLLTQDTTK